MSKKMEKFLGICVVVTFLVFGCLIWPLHADESEKIPEVFRSIEQLKSYFGTDVVYRAIQKNGEMQLENIDCQNFMELPSTELSSMDIPSMAPTSTSIGYWDINMVINNIPYYATIRSINYITTNVGPITQISQLCCVPNGGSVTLTNQTVKCNTIKVAAGVNIALGVLKLVTGQVSIDYTHSVCTTISKGQVFTFPTMCNGYLYTSYYAASTFDCFDVTYDIIPFTGRVNDFMNCLQDKNNYGLDNYMSIVACGFGKELLPNYSMATTYQTQMFIPSQIVWPVCGNVYSK